MAIAADHLVTNYQAAQAPPGPGQWTARFGHLIQRWRARMAERHALGLFDDRDLHDAGMSRSDVEQELAKPFWRD